MYVELHPEADNELIENALFYEHQVIGLGYRFIEEIERGIEILIEQPRIGQLLDEEFRCFVMGDFPFSLIYRIEADRLWIVAVSHQMRRLGYWRGRVDR